MANLLPAMPSLTPEEMDQLQKRNLTSNDFAVRATVVRTANSTAMNVGDKFWITHSGDLIGFTGGGCVRSAMKKAAAKVTKRRKARLVRSVPPGRLVTAKQDSDLDVYRSSCPSKGEVDIFLEPVSFRTRTMIFGTSELSKFIATLAKEAGHDVNLLSGNQDVANDIYGSPDFIIIATQGVGDKDALEAALSTACPHIFFVASQKKADHLGASLKAERVKGWSRVISPAGLNIGAQGPVEIAISIMAQLIDLRSSKEEGACA